MSSIDRSNGPVNFMLEREDIRLGIVGSRFDIDVLSESPIRLDGVVPSATIPLSWGGSKDGYGYTGTRAQN